MQKMCDDDKLNMTEKVDAMQTRSSIRIFVSAAIIQNNDYN